MQYSTLNNLHNSKTHVTGKGARGCMCNLILLMMDQPVRNMWRKTVNVKKKNKSVSSWKRNKVFINDARSTKHKDLKLPSCEMCGRYVRPEF